MNDYVDPYYIHVIRQIAKAIGWTKLRALVNKLAKENS